MKKVKIKDSLLSKFRLITGRKPVFDYVIQVDYLPNKFVGMYFGVIFVLSEDDDKTIIHELVHAQQHQEVGFFKFPFLYLFESLTKGYFYNEYEIEARFYEEM